MLFHASVIYLSVLTICLVFLAGCCAIELIDRDTDNVSRPVVLVLAGLCIACAAMNIGVLFLILSPKFGG